MKWYVYIARCKDNTLYTGITTNIDRREFEHNHDNKLGSKYIRNKRPVSIIYSEVYLTQSEARKRESAIKNWTRKSKLKLIEKLQKSGNFLQKIFRAASSTGRATPS